MAFDGTHTHDDGRPAERASAWRAARARGAFAPAGGRRPAPERQLRPRGRCSWPTGRPSLTGDCCGGAAFIFHGALKVGDAVRPASSVQNRSMARDQAGNVWVGLVRPRPRHRHAADRRHYGRPARRVAPSLPTRTPSTTPAAGSRSSAIPWRPAAAIIYLAGRREAPAQLGPGRGRRPTTDRDGGNGRPASVRSTPPTGRTAASGWPGSCGPASADPTVQFTLGDARGAGQPSYPVVAAEARHALPPAAAAGRRLPAPRRQLHAHRAVRAATRSGRTSSASRARSSTTRARRTCRCSPARSRARSASRCCSRRRLSAEAPARRGPRSATARGSARRRASQRAPRSCQVTGRS